jgi:hypothetical protein
MDQAVAESGSIMGHQRPSPTRLCPSFKSFIIIAREETGQRPTGRPDCRHSRYCDCWSDAHLDFRDSRDRRLPSHVYPQQEKFG